MNEDARLIQGRHVNSDEMRGNRIYKGYILGRIEIMPTSQN